MKIYTDKKWHDFKYGYEVPPSIMASEFDYMNEEDTIDGFIKYRGRWYHASSFTSVTKDVEEFRGWDGYLSDSFFSGILIKISQDGEQYKIGTFIS